jgi:hypothetical protein
LNTTKWIHNSNFSQPRINYKSWNSQIFKVDFVMRKKKLNIIRYKHNQTGMATYTIFSAHWQLEAYSTNSTEAALLILIPHFKICKIDLFQNVYEV